MPFLLPSSYLLQDGRIFHCQREQQTDPDDNLSHSTILSATTNKCWLWTEEEREWRSIVEITITHDWGPMKQSRGQGNDDNGEVNADTAQAQTNLNQGQPMLMDHVSRRDDEDSVDVWVERNGEKKKENNAEKTMAMRSGKKKEDSLPHRPPLPRNMVIGRRDPAAAASASTAAQSMDRGASYPRLKQKRYGGRMRRKQTTATYGTCDSGRSTPGIQKQGDAPLEHGQIQEKQTVANCHQASSFADSKAPRSLPVNLPSPLDTTSSSYHAATLVPNSNNPAVTALISGGAQQIPHLPDGTRISAELTNPLAMTLAAVRSQKRDSEVPSSAGILGSTNHAVNSNVPTSSPRVDFGNSFSSDSFNQQQHALHLRQQQLALLHGDRRNARLENLFMADSSGGPGGFAAPLYGSTGAFFLQSSRSPSIEHIKTSESTATNPYDNSIFSVQQSQSDAGGMPLSIIAMLRMRQQQMRAGYNDELATLLYQYGGPPAPSTFDRLTRDSVGDSFFPQQHDEKRRRTATRGGSLGQEHEQQALGVDAACTSASSSSASLATSSCSSLFRTDRQPTGSLLGSRRMTALPPFPGVGNIYFPPYGAGSNAGALTGALAAQNQFLPGESAIPAAFQSCSLPYYPPSTASQSTGLGSAICSDQVAANNTIDGQWTDATSDNQNVGEGDRAKVVSTTPSSSKKSKSSDQRSRLLYVEGDEQYLTEYQCLLRKQLEVFEAGPNDLRGSTQGRNVPIIRGQVGLRCGHCAYLPLAARTKGAVYYSQTIEGMYQIAQNMSKVHLCQRCYRIPSTVQSKLLSLKSDSRRATGGKEYWTKALKTMGVYEDGKVLKMK